MIERDGPLKSISRETIRGEGQTASPTQRPGPLGVGGPRRHRLLHAGAQHRAVHAPFASPLSQWSNEPLGLLQEPDRRARARLVGVRVRPRPDQALARAAQAREQPRDRVASTPSAQPPTA